MEIQRHKTAISRKKESLPAYYLMECYKVYDWSKSLLDWGCGKGKDLEYYQQFLSKVMGYDPYWQPELPNEMFDIVTCSYVLNVIEDPDERFEVVKQMSSYLKKGGTILLSTRACSEIKKAATKSNWDDFNDGFRTSKGTFQVGLSTNDLQSYLQEAGSFELQKVQSTSSFSRILAIKN